MRRALGFCLPFFIATAAVAQDTRTVDLEPLRSVRGLESYTTTSRNPSQDRQRYIAATSRIREHHRPVPLPKTTKPFATEMSQVSATVVKKGEPISFPKNIKILAQKSIVGAAKLEYDFASPVGEPTVAVRGDEILTTGNWYATLSLDAGKTFSALNPEQLFAGDPIGDGFCCDQVALYDKRDDAIYWLLQGRKNARGNNFRVLVAKGSEQIRKQDWFFIDITSSQAVGSEGFWLDFPSFTTTEANVFISANIFRTDGDEKWAGSVVIRVPKEPLLRGEKPAATTWVTQTFGSPRLVDGAKGAMYWASHSSTGDLAVWSWADGQPQPKGPATVDIEPWTTDPGPSVAGQSPSGRPWLKRLDGRITAGWSASGSIGFAWTAREDNRFKLPHVRVALIDESAILSAGPLAEVKPIAEPHIWSDEFAIAYPAVAPDVDGKIGASVSIGGKTLNPSHAVGTLSRVGGALKWGFAVPTRGKNTPACTKSDESVDRECGVWGDYFATRPHPTRAGSWVSVGYSVQSTDLEKKVRIEPEYVWFNSE